MENTTEHLNEYPNATAFEEDAFMKEAKSYVIYKIGDGINKTYFPILVPIGVVGNILSFLVMMQPKNRHMSLSLYISSLATTDTIILLIGITAYLNAVHFVDMPPNLQDYCAVSAYVVMTSSLSSTLFILSMTFDRFYSVIRPHKAASFNTARRAKITIVVIVIISAAFTSPQLIIITHVGRQCIPDLSKTWQIFYYWLSYAVNFAIPFVSLLVMNSVIIHALRTRSILGSGGQGQSQGQKGSKSDQHVYGILLLVTFTFLVLISPLYVMNAYIMFVDYTETPFSYAQFYIFYQFAFHLYYTNNGVNFFLYVISGQKFRSDLRNLFKCKGLMPNNGSLSDVSQASTRISTIQ